MSCGAAWLNTSSKTSRLTLRDASNKPVLRLVVPEEHKGKGVLLGDGEGRAIEFDIEPLPARKVEKSVPISDEQQS